MCMSCTIEADQEPLTLCSGRGKSHQGVDSFAFLFKPGTFRTRYLLHRWPRSCSQNNLLLTCVLGVADPMMQALQDAKIVGELVEMAKNLRTDLGHTVDEFVNAGHELTLTLNRALQQKDLENVKQIEEELNREFGKLSGVSPLV